MTPRSPELVPDALSTIRRITGFVIMAWVYMLAETVVRADEIAARAIARLPRRR